MLRRPGAGVEVVQVEGVRQLSDIPTASAASAR